MRDIERNVCHQMVPDVIKILCFKYYLTVAKQLWLINQDIELSDGKRIQISPEIDVSDGRQTISIDKNTKNYGINMLDIMSNNKPEPMIGKIEGGICCLNNVIFEKNEFIRKVQAKEGRHSDVVFEIEKECAAKLIYRHHQTKGT